MVGMVPAEFVERDSIVRTGVVASAVRISPSDQPGINDRSIDKG
jgi:hypothetical protein